MFELWAAFIVGILFGFAACLFGAWLAYRDMKRMGK